MGPRSLRVAHVALPLAAVAGIPAVPALRRGGPTAPAAGLLPGVAPGPEDLFVDATAERGMGFVHGVADGHMDGPLVPREAEKVGR